MKKLSVICAFATLLFATGCQFSAVRSVPGTSFKRLQTTVSNGVPMVTIEDWNSKKDFHIVYNPQTGQFEFADVMNPSNTIAGGQANTESLQVSGQTAVQFTGALAQLAGAAQATISTMGANQLAKIGAENLGRAIANKTAPVTTATNAPAN